MGDLIFDPIIAYLIKVVIRFYRIQASRGWKIVKAKISSSVVGGGWVWDCPTVEVSYTFDLDGRTYRATDVKPFFYDTFAELDAGRFVPGQAAFVRVKPQDPQGSLLRRDDQPNKIDETSKASSKSV